MEYSDLADRLFKLASTAARDRDTNRHVVEVTDPVIEELDTLIQGMWDELSEEAQREAEETQWVEGQRKRSNR